MKQPYSLHKLPLLFAFILLCLGCANAPQKNTTTPQDSASPQSSPRLQHATIADGLYFWKGQIDGHIPVWIWLKIKDSLATGQVVYTQAKHPAPITLIGQIDDGDLRVCEYQPDGNITGVFVFNHLSADAGGIWAGTKNDKDHQFILLHADTTVTGLDTSLKPIRIAGEYSYQYGEDGAQGSMTVDYAGGDSISFSIGCVTRAPSRNLAEVDSGSAKLVRNSFTYHLPDADSCAFRVRFYRDFAVINYLYDYSPCAGQFGMNAGVDGVFYKTGK